MKKNARKTLGGLQYEAAIMDRIFEANSSFHVK